MYQEDGDEHGSGPGEEGDTRRQEAKPNRPLSALVGAAHGFTVSVKGAVTIRPPSFI